jgi:hypothetical protein
MTNSRFPDFCPKCKGPAIFYESRRIPTRDGYGEIAIGMLSCAGCGKEEIAYKEVLPAWWDNLHKGGAA